MGEPLIVYVDNPRVRVIERARARESIGTLLDTYEVSWLQSTDPYAYSRILRLAWRHDGPLINIEHDIVIAPHHIAELLDCPHPVCAWSYWISPATTGLTYPFLTGQPGTFVDRPGIGLIKVEESARRGEPPGLAPWKEVELSVWRAVGRPFHMHGPPVEHLHGFLEGAYGNRVGDRAGKSATADR